jgi:hypothetical protein
MTRKDKVKVVVLMNMAASQKVAVAEVAEAIMMNKKYCILNKMLSNWRAFFIL